MRVGMTRNGLTVRVIAGTTNTILGIDLEETLCRGCLGFSIRRTAFGPVEDPFPPEKIETRWLPNLLQFPSDKSKSPVTTETAPLQKFRWGDYTCDPGHTYRYQVVPRYGAPGRLTPTKLDGSGVTVEVTTEDNRFAPSGAPRNPRTAVFFNRGAAASNAFERHFPRIRTEAQLLADTPQAAEAKKWLSRGLEEALLSFLAQAKDDSFALHAAIYEFQKPTLLAGLAAAHARKAEVHVVYHHRQKGAKDTTASKNDGAIKAAKLSKSLVTPRHENPQSAIMHNKFVVLLRDRRGKQTPIAVWTGSTNWTDGAIYGQLNVGHAVYDPDIAEVYERYFQLLKEDPSAEDTKHALSSLTPVSLIVPAAHGVTPVLSPQPTDTMLHLYSSICATAKCVMVCAPFALSPIVLAAFTSKSQDNVLRFFLLDKESSLGKGQEVQVIEHDPHNAIGAAATLPSPLHNFQGKVLEGKESFRHAGVHIHSKIILADPLGSDPILVTGSANFSNNSTEVNDSNSLVFRGDTSVADIYATEFMRMFEHYHFRASEAAALKRASAKRARGGRNGRKQKDPSVLALEEDDSWSAKYFVHGSDEEADRRMFAGTH
jgi:phosphatidylserine/phosphatidylglycerophosphate/cardiolipin synthase-like enzyme